MAVRQRGLCGRNPADRGPSSVGLCVDAPRRGGGRRAHPKMKPKNQRLILVSAALVAVLVAVLLAMWGLRDRASYFYTPAEIAAGKAEEGRAVRLGGMVEKGSVRHGADGVTISFQLTDGQASTPVTYRGIVPDLFREGSGAVAEGRVGKG